jgi:predicted metalloprotease with PDZ domain
LLNIALGRLFRTRNMQNVIEYQIDSSDLPSNFIQIRISFISTKENPVLKIAAWRPGRYILQNYAANVRDCSAVDEKGLSLAVYKTSKNNWELQGAVGAKITFNYLYYCRQMDAGGCWADEELFYINTIACLMAVDGQEEVPCELKLNLPENFKIGTGMPKQDDSYLADSFIALSDFPIMASPSLSTFKYEVQGIPFYIHSTVDASHYPESLLSDFEKFTITQIQDFGSFPEKEYHFLLVILPYQHYHGVEHRNSTVICLGPAHSIKDALYNELLGICSHELYHTWNICKIRPAEMLPYNLFEPNYFKTGFIAEGVTTYLGDFYLALSNVLTKDWYKSEINILLKKHFYSFGNKHLSLTDSSFDLWVDGYDAGIPNRKVSIYVKGAITALLMDAALRESTNNTINLRGMMRRLWNSSSSTYKSYTENSIESLFHELTSNTYIDAYHNWIYGLGDLKPDLIAAFNYLNIDVKGEAHSNFFACNFGFLCDTNFNVQLVDDASPYSNRLGKGDRILRINRFPIAECVIEELEELDTMFVDITNGIQTWEVEFKRSESVYFKTLRLN